MATEEKIDADATRLKKKAPVYENLSASKQTFDQVGMFVAQAGFLMLKGRNGRPDQMFDLEKAIKRIFSMARTYFQWMHNGFTAQCDQFRQVLIEMSSKFQEAIAQRIGLGLPVPKWFTPFVADKLTKLIKRLKQKQ